MKPAVRNVEKKRRYKVVFRREGEPKIRYVEYLWATSAREAEQIVRNLRDKGDRKILKIKAGALR